jgi:type I restriction enzyme S subunit
LTATAPKAIRIRDRTHIFGNLSNTQVKKVKECYDIQLGKMSSEKARQGNNHRNYIKNNNVLWGEFDFSDLPQMSFDEREVRKYALRTGDLLVCEGGEIGRAAIWKEEMPEMLYQKALHRLRPKSDHDIPDFMFHYLRYCATRGILEGVATGTTIRHLPVEQLSELALPFPSQENQEDIAYLLNGILRGNADVKKKLLLAKVVKAEVLANFVAGD